MCECLGFIKNGNNSIYFFCYRDDDLFLVTVWKIGFIVAMEILFKKVSMAMKKGEKNVDPN